MSTMCFVPDGPESVCGSRLSLLRDDVTGNTRPLLRHFKSFSIRTGTQPPHRPFICVSLCTQLSFPPLALLDRLL